MLNNYISPSIKREQKHKDIIAKISDGKVKTIINKLRRENKNQFDYKSFKIKKLFGWASK